MTKNNGVALKSIWLVLLIAIWGRCALAAETFDLAVTELAEKLAASRDASAQPLRVAVMPFKLPDKQTSQLSIRIMNEFIQRLVSAGPAKFIVRERLQIETIFKELSGRAEANALEFKSEQIEEMCMFLAKELKERTDPNAPGLKSDQLKEICKFLTETEGGADLNAQARVEPIDESATVDALVVGEIFPESDNMVRVDARLTSAQGGQVLWSASALFPLTPTYRVLLENPYHFVPLRGIQAIAVARNGLWKGEGSCGETTFGMAIEMVFEPDGTVSALQAHYPGGQNAVEMTPGILSMQGHYIEEENKLELTPVSWLYQPRGGVEMPISGKMNVDEGTFSGTFDNEYCKTLNLRRVK